MDRSNSSDGVNLADWWKKKVGSLEASLYRSQWCQKDSGRAVSVQQIYAAGGGDAGLKNCRKFHLAGADTCHMTTPVGFTDTTKLVESFSVMVFSDAAGSAADGAQVIGHEKWSGHNGPQSHLRAGLLHAEAEVARNQLWRSSCRCQDRLVLREPVDNVQDTVPGVLDVAIVTPQVANLTQLSVVHLKSKSLNWI
ncbi:hypothetical protein EYF80_028190 [Liparis tanakae]|uniref:Uncharacterized protein n=1 Tax=Liparis tanakae TaxID=230148 RepID=A0A4Z2H6N5_9TELE|nr:hypothetical protein EYF80_028190 [Liparis tanakae]